MKLRMHLRSRPEMWILECDHFILGSSTPGMCYEGIIATVNLFPPHWFWNANNGGFLFTAALTMYQRARKLHDFTGNLSQVLVLAEEQLESYVVAMNALSLLDHANAWIVMPITSDDGRDVSYSSSYVLKSTECPSVVEQAT